MLQRFSALLLAWSLALWPSWDVRAQDQCETQLDECATRLETSIEQRENLSDIVSEQKSLIEKQQSTINAQKSLISDQNAFNDQLVSRLNQTKNSWTEYRKRMQEEIDDAREQRWLFAGGSLAIGIGVGALGALILAH